MNKKIFLGLAAGLMLFAACQNELYKNPLEDFKAPQGIYVTNKGTVQIFVEEGQSTAVKELKVALAQKNGEGIKVRIEAGDEAQLEAYNKKNNTEYLMLPKKMYNLSTDMVFEPGVTLQAIPLVLKDVEFPLAGDYALPIKIKEGSTTIIDGEDEVLLVLEKRIRTKSLRMKGYGSEKADMFPNDFKVDQWTMEVMVNRASYNANNRSICGTKLVQNAGPHDEIYTRFGDVTIDPNQLQIKTGSSQIDVEKSKFAAKPDTWYMLAFVYDGHKNMVYVNGELVAEREIRTGPYGLIGFWIGGSNELVREVRFWKTARTAKQLKAYTWKMVDPTDDNLLLYYPGNGKKRDAATGEIVDDETMIWDWSKNAKHLSKPSSATFDDNGGKYYTFPMEEK
ncbi:BT_3987 domain-containing protein [Bacteroides pyogenes]|uniref:BT_3987 domain-containing protein n=1 Tax=Bacteroides pyogenes TaxID=310300 RepID=UPI003B43725F